MWQLHAAVCSTHCFCVQCFHKTDLFTGLPYLILRWSDWVSDWFSDRVTKFTINTSANWPRLRLILQSRDRDQDRFSNWRLSSRLEFSECVTEVKLTAKAVPSGLPYVPYSTAWEKRWRTCSSLQTSQPGAGRSMVMSWTSSRSSSESGRTSFINVMMQSDITAGEWNCKTVHHFTIRSRRVTLWMR